MKRAVKAVLFDFGHVLSLPPLPEDTLWLRERCGLSAGEYTRLYFELRHEFDRGALSPEGYWSRMLAAGGVPATAGLLRELERRDMESWTRPNLPVLQWAGELRRGGWATGILSNMPPGFLPLLENCFPETSEFAPRVFSSRVGMIKPEPGIFQHALCELGLPPGQVLFLDDMPRNVHAALALGLQAVVFHSVEDCARQLAEGFELPALLPAEAVKG